MSMETLRRMQSYYAEQDRATDAMESKFAKKAKEQLPEEELKAQGEELYVKVVNSITKQLKTKAKATISCKFRPHCVFDYVVNRLKKKGWKAKHYYNYGFNFFDIIEASPPDPTKNLIPAPVRKKNC